jgi:hypothetical protein
VTRKPRGRPRLDGTLPTEDAVDPTFQVRVTLRQSDLEFLRRDGARTTSEQIRRLVDEARKQGEMAGL